MPLLNKASQCYPAMAGAYPRVQYVVPTRIKAYGYQLIEYNLIHHRLPGYRRNNNNRAV